VGVYSGIGFEDEAPMWLNEDGMGIWRHGGFWYIGDYASWPPQTYYRCVVGCEQSLDIPPLTGYKQKKDVSEDDTITLQLEPCGASSEL
jgi:hypothetical protein